MATSIPQDHSFLQKRRVRARILSLSFLGAMILGWLTWPTWSVVGIWLPYELIQLLLWVTFLCFPLSVFFFAAALKYVKLQQHLRTPVDLQMSREKLAQALRTSRVRLVVWVVLLFSPLYAALILSTAGGMDRGSGLALFFGILFVVPVLTVCGLFGSLFEFNNNRALSIMLSWASAEATPEMQASNL